jgi:acylphosphatase
MSRSRQLRAIVTGRVQGVYFRGATEERARSLDLSGWVRNRPDGTVEVMARGPEARLQALLVFLRQGPPAARVISVETEWLDEEDLPSPFEIRG